MNGILFGELRGKSSAYGIRRYVKEGDSNLSETDGFHPMLFEVLEIEKTNAIKQTFLRCETAFAVLKIDIHIDSPLGFTYSMDIFLRAFESRFDRAANLQLRPVNSDSGPAGRVP